MHAQKFETFPKQCYLLFNIIMEMASIPVILFSGHAIFKISISKTPKGLRMFHTFTFDLLPKLLFSH